MKKIFLFIIVIYLIIISGCAKSLEITNNPKTSTPEHTATESTAIKVIKTSSPNLLPTPTPSPTATPLFWLIDCWDSADSQYALNQCAVLQQDASSSELQNILDKLYQALDTKQQNDLQKVQKMWEAYRDADCQFYASLSRGGSMEGMQYFMCQYSHDVERYRSFKLILCDSLGKREYCK